MSTDQHSNEINQTSKRKESGNLSNALPRKQRLLNEDDILLEEFRSSIKHGQPLNFRNFGLQYSAYAKLLKKESQEKIVKKKDYMKDI